MSVLRHSLNILKLTIIFLKKIIYFKFQYIKYMYFYKYFPFMVLKSLSGKKNVNIFLLIIIKKRPTFWANIRLYFYCPLDYVVKRQKKIKF